MLWAMTVLLGFQLVGEAIVAGLGWPIPGPVVGMVLLFVALCVRGEVPEGLRSTAGTLLQYLSLLFVPAGAGVMVHLGLLQEDALAIGAALLVSTVLSLVVCALVFRALAARQEKP